MERVDPNPTLTLTPTLTLILTLNLTLLSSWHDGRAVRRRETRRAQTCWLLRPILSSVLEGSVRVRVRSCSLFLFLVPWSCVGVGVGVGVGLGKRSLTGLCHP